MKDTCSRGGDMWSSRLVCAMSISLFATNGKPPLKTIDCKRLYGFDQSDYIKRGLVHSIFISLPSVPLAAQDRLKIVISSRYFKILERFVVSLTITEQSFIPSRLV